MQKIVSRLEQALCYWEDFCFGLGVTYRIAVGRELAPESGLRGVLVNYQELRDSMLNIFSADPGELSQKYLYPMEANTFSNDTQAMYLPHALLAWSHYSRRVFNLDRDLQVLLDATSLEGVVWGDIRFPFDSFLVTLGRPITDASGTPFDAVLVSNMTTSRPGEDETRESVFILLDSRLENYKPIGVQEKERISSLLKRGILRKAERQLSSALKGPGSGVSTSYFVLDSTYADSPVINIRYDEIMSRRPSYEKRADDKDPGSLYESALRIIAGTCLYLKTLPAKSSFVSDWEKPEPHRTERGASITNKAQVCTVSCQFKLTAEENEAFGGKEGEPVKSFGEKCCHFRRGTWCRPPGHGDDPSHPKTIWRRPTLVRPDKLKPGELPKGAETILLK